MKIGFIGNGIVGGATRQVAELHHSDIKIFDPPQGFKDDPHDCDVIFISVPVPTRPDGTQDLTILKQSVEMCPKDAWIFVRSSVLPGTCDSLRGTDFQPLKADWLKDFDWNKLGGAGAGGGGGGGGAFGLGSSFTEFKVELKSPETVKYKKLYAVPEFLTERQAGKDAIELPIIAPAEAIEKLKEIFPIKSFIPVGDNREAEMAKYVHNCFCAMKVGFFNTIYRLCTDNGLAYSRVVEAASNVTGFILPTHTKVPGPDGQFGFGGKCFPKDLFAFVTWLESEMGETFLRGVFEENFKNRFGGLF